MTRSRSPSMLSSRVIGRSSQSGPLQGVVTLGTIGQMALFVSSPKCQHYYDSGQSSGAPASARPLLDGVELPANRDEHRVLGIAAQQAIHALDALVEPGLEISKVLDVSQSAALLSPPHCLPSRILHRPPGSPLRLC